VRRNNWGRAALVAVSGVALALVLGSPVSAEPFGHGDSGGPGGSSGPGGPGRPGGGNSNWPCDAGETRARRTLSEMYPGHDFSLAPLGDIMSAWEKYNYDAMTPEQKSAFTDAISNAFYWTCNGFNTGSIVVPGLLPTAAEVIAVLPWDVWSTIDPPDPAIDRNPGIGVSTVVRLPVYVWTTNLAPLSAVDTEASLGGPVVVTVTATPTLIVGAAPNATGFSSPACPPYNGAPTGCAIDFRRSGIGVPATVTVTWTGVGQVTVNGVPRPSVNLGVLARTTTFFLDVEEVQAINE